ncbi:MAG: PTS transporter subunit EIIC [Coprobacillaceae bacterium]
MSRLGPDSILVGMISGNVTALVFNLYAKLHVLEDNVTLPDFVSEWINNVLPIIGTLAVGMILTVNLEIDVYAVIGEIFMPLQSFGQTLPGLIVLVFLPAFFYTTGISTWLFSAVQTPIFMAGIQANIDAVAKGLPATNIVTNETVYTLALIMMGGTGATLLLNVFMAFSKSKKLKTMGRICIGPSLFNINEPLVFGAPIVFNPILMVPMWINSLIGPIVIWFAMSSGLLNIPDQLMQVAQIPAPINSVIVTNGDLRAVIWYVVLFVIYAAVWYPFFKVYEKQCLAEEKIATTTE